MALVCQDISWGHTSTTNPKSCEDGTFFLEFALFSLIKTQILSLEGMMNV